MLKPQISTPFPTITACAQVFIYLPTLFRLDWPHESEKQFCDWITKKEPLATLQWMTYQRDINWYNSRINCSGIIFSSPDLLFFCIQYSIKCNGTRHDSLLCGIILISKNYFGGTTLFGQKLSSLRWLVRLTFGLWHWWQKLKCSMTYWFKAKIFSKLYMYGMLPLTFILKNKRYFYA